jgi:hypothetical protein
VEFSSKSSSSRSSCLTNISPFNAVIASVEVMIDGLDAYAAAIANWEVGLVAGGLKRKADLETIVQSTEEFGPR